MSTFTWKATPAGPEQKLLNKILKDKKFNANSTPSDVKSQYREFDHVSSETFRKHFNLTKVKFGIGLCDGSFPRTPNAIPTETEVNEPGPSNAKKVKRSLDVAVADVDNNTVLKNPPVLVSEYTDPDTEEQKVIVVAMMFEGAIGFNFKLSDDGEYLTINYNWPKCSYELKDLFKDALLRVPVPTYAKMTALKESLSKLRENKTEAPTGLFRIKLPIKVQTDKRTWTSEGLQIEDGGMAAIINLTGIQSSYTIEEKDTEIQFKKVSQNKKE